MRNNKQPYQMGDAVEYNEEFDLQDSIHFTDKTHKPGSKPYGKRIGTIDNMVEAEEPGSIEDQNDEQVKAAAMEEFSKKIKQAVSAKLMGRKINLKIKGHKDLVDQIVKMIKFESDYLNAIISGQAAETPALKKNKAIIDMEAKKLDRMLKTTDFWPFK